MRVTGWAAVAAVAALAMLGGAWVGPLPALATQSFTAHMVAHMIVVAVAAPLLAFAVATRHRPLPRSLAWLSPVPASLAELVVVWLWHTPRLHHAARIDALMYVAEQTSFLGAGLALWLAVWAAVLTNRGRSAGAAVLALLLTLAHMTLLGALIALSPRPLFAHDGAVDGLLDQQRGGAVMLVVSAVVYVGAGVLVTRRLLQPGLRPVERVS